MDVWISPAGCLQGKATTVFQGLVCDATVLETTSLEAQPAVR